MIAALFKRKWSRHFANSCIKTKRLLILEADDWFRRLFAFFLYERRTFEPDVDEIEFELLTWEGSPETARTASGTARTHSATVEWTAFCGPGLDAEWQIWWSAPKFIVDDSQSTIPFAERTRFLLGDAARNETMLVEFLESNNPERGR